MKPTLTLIACSCLVACSAPGVVQTGPNTYLSTRSSAGGAFANTSRLKADTISDANTFAASKGKVAEGLSIKEVRPIIGGFPSCEYQFRLAAPGAGSTKDKAITSGSIHVETGE